MGSSDKQSLKSHLVVLILHVIKWYSQPWARSRSWVNSIKNSRREITDILTDHPSMMRMVDVLIPEACLKAIKKAEDEMKFPPTYTQPTKNDLFDKEYKIDDKG